MFQRFSAPLRATGGRRAALWPFVSEHKKSGQITQFLFEALDCPQGKLKKNAHAVKQREHQLKFLLEPKCPNFEQRRKADALSVCFHKSRKNRAEKQIYFSTVAAQ
ncbi:MAG: hypothetical protein K2K43_03755 [Alistipes sp.]|nr:hypothetical protein [Alistipes sp.]